MDGGMMVAMVVLVVDDGLTGYSQAGRNERSGLHSVCTILRASRARQEVSIFYWLFFLDDESHKSKKERNNWCFLSVATSSSSSHLQQHTEYFSEFLLSKVHIRIKGW